MAKKTQTPGSARSRASKATKATATKAQHPVEKPPVMKRALPDDGLSSAFHLPPASIPSLPASPATSPVVAPAATTDVPQGERAKGLVCRKCGCRHFYTRNTIETEAGIKRYRECRNCGRIVTTFERAV